jgi:hypothetical protein
VGPTARGNFDTRAQRALQGIGDWMDLHARSIYGATASPFAPPTDVRYTQQGNRLYVHIFSWPLEHLHLPDLAGKVEYAQLLNDASEIGFRVIDPAVPPRIRASVVSRPAFHHPADSSPEVAGCRLVRAGSDDDATCGSTPSLDAIQTQRGSDGHTRLP